MKRILLLILLLPLYTFAQKSELGISAGIALNSAPSGSLFFKADKPGITPAIALTQTWNLNRYSESLVTWQVGVGVYNFAGFRNQSDRTYVYFNDTIGNDGRDFRYAYYAYAIGPVANLKYKLNDLAYIYGGASFCIAGSRNTSNRSAADFRGKDYTYTAPDGGIGYYARLHGGITYRLSQRIAVNAEIGYSYYHLNFKVNDLSYPGGTEFSYATKLVPFTAGIRYRMGWAKEISRESGRKRIVKEEVESKRTKE